MWELLVGLFLLVLSPNRFPAMTSKLDQLRDSMRRRAGLWLAQVGPRLLPGWSVEVLETYRTVAQELAYIGAGTSHIDPANAARAPHPERRALDFVLRDSLGRAWWGQEGDPPAVIGMYMALGELWELLGGRWGGRFAPIDQNGVGFDPGHLEEARTQA